METKLRILFVEDDAIDRMAIERFIHDECPEYDCRMVESVEAAASALREAPFDAIVTDYKLNRQTGFDVIDLKPHAPVIFITGNGDEEVAVKALKAGAYDYLIKDKDSQFLKVLPMTVENSIRRYKAEEIARKVRFEESIAGVFRMDLEGGLLECNNSFANMIGYVTASELLVSEASNLFCTQHKMSHFMDDIRKRGSMLNDQVHFHDRNGEEVVGLVNAKVVQQSLEDPEWVEGSMIDLTKHYQMEQKKDLLEAQLLTMQKLEALGTLAGGIAHDFNNILGAIQGYSELAIEELEVTSPARDNVREVLEACKHAKNLVSQILSFSRRQKPKREPVSLVKMLNEHLHLIQPNLPQNIRMVFDHKVESDMVLGDTVQLGQVFVNLCMNGIHAMKMDGGSLSILLSEVELESANLLEDHPLLKPGRYLRLSVRDQGSGIPSALRDKIFEPFFTTKQVGEGTGMGLAVVHGIVRNHGGEIRVNSQIGEGTEFEILLEPVPRQSSKLDEPESVMPSLKNAGEAQTIMVVDDDISSLRVVSKLLECLNYRVEPYQSAAQAAEDFSQRPMAFDLILTDFMMPEINGVEFIRQVRSVQPHIPAIIYTGYDQFIDQADFKALDVGRVLLKPVGLEDLRLAIPEVLATKAL